MRRKISLYIGDRLADLDDQSFILFNYTMEDLSNPTIVKNAFSQQITLKGTPANNAIFGDFFRNDRVTQYSGNNETGIYFDPNRKTSFTIYNELSEIVESGYLKLDRVKRRRNTVEYTCTLYGGLGSFLYGISYDSNGDRLSLADLTFPYSLGFTISRTTVKAAWDQLYNDPNGSNKWSIINFAPCYNGKPTKPFDANKCLVHSDTYGLPIKDGDYGLYNEFSLVTLNEEVTEQETKDYRSYLQRPVLRVKALINAICSSANNGGYTVNLDPEFFDSGNPYWEKTWITLPMLQDINLDVQSDSGQFQAYPPTTYTIPNGGSISTLYTVDLSIRLSFAFPGGYSGHYVMHCEDDWAAGQQDETPGYYLNYVEFAVTLYDSSNNVIDTVTMRTSTAQPDANLPQMDYLFDHIEASSGIPYRNGQQFNVPLKIAGYGVAKVKVEMAEKALAWGHLRGSAMNYYVWAENETDAQNGVDLGSAPTIDPYESELKWYSESSSTVRTGASVTQAALLSGEHTPADYLLSFCKTFGLQMVCHKDSKEVDILLRKNFYNGSTIDLTDRIDRKVDIDKIPFAYDARWYKWATPHQGDYAEWYAEKYGDYGRQRVNTGFAFNAETRDLTGSIVFNGVCDSLEVSKYFCDLERDGFPIPSVFLAGGKYTLYKGGSESKEYDLPFLGASTRQWINADYDMHDDWSKPQFHKADNAHMDIRDVMLFFVDVVYPYSDHCTLSDDTREMLALNGNNPCWLPNYCDYDTAWQLARMPRFSRYLWNVYNVTSSLDFGTPAEVNVPGVNFNADSNIFDQYWANYITDRYDDDSAVVTAMVDLRGYQVNENLLRNFYFFDGAYWAMNKIVNYSLTTWGLVQCEFVKVQSTTNYTTY